MLGLFGAISILIATLVAFAIIYKKETGRNFFADLYNDIRNR